VLGFSILKEKIMFAAISPTVGTQPFNDWFTPDTTARHVLGMEVTAVDPYWGLGTFMYVKSTDTILKGSVCMFDEAYNAVLCPSTAGQGFPVGVAMAPMTTGKYGWIQVAGRVVYATVSTVAADTTIGISGTGAGLVGAATTGKQLVNARNRIAATATVTVTAQTQAGIPVVNTADYKGFFLGMALSGTGIVASSIVATLDPDGRRIGVGTTIGTLTAAQVTATGSITLTGTYTGYGSGVINRPFVQGQIV
jgi:hypothetical protein